MNHGTNAEKDEGSLPRGVRQVGAKERIMTTLTGNARPSEAEATARERPASCTTHSMEAFGALARQSTQGGPVQGVQETPWAWTPLDGRPGRGGGVHYLSSAGPSVGEHPLPKHPVGAFNLRGVADQLAGARRERRKRTRRSAWPACREFATPSRIPHLPVHPVARPSSLLRKGVCTRPCVSEARGACTSPSPARILLSNTRMSSSATASPHPFVPPSPPKNPTFIFRAWCLGPGRFLGVTL